MSRSSRSPDPFSSSRQLVVTPVFLAALALLAGCAHAPSTPPGRTGPGSHIPDRLGTAVVAETVTLGTRELLEKLRRDGSGSIFAYELRETSFYEYRDEASGENILTIEDWLVKSDLDSFGLMSCMFPEGAAFIDTGGGGYLSREEAGFFKGSHFIRALAGTPLSLGREDLREILEGISERLPGMDTPPPEVTLLGKLAGDPMAAVYRADSLMGSPLLAPGLIAEMPNTPPSSIVIFISRRDSREKARSDFQGYLASMDGGPKGISFSVGVGDVAALVWDRRYGWINLSISDTRLVGISGLGNPEDGWRMINRIWSTLGE